MSNSIPPKVDIIILGTGLTNSILAAACSRIGKSVLHLDKNTYYGEQWASFTLQQLLDYIRSQDSEHPALKFNNNERFKELVEKKSKLFCIDLCPRPLFSNGSMVDLLVSSNVTRYHEFKNNVRILSMVKDGEEIHQIPCQRSDVFNSPLLSNLVEKRKLMKFIEMCLDEDNVEIADSANKPIELFLQEKGLENTIKEYIINSIAMVSPQETTNKACDNIRNFMTSTRRFGKSPFLLPMYGTGEFPQSFCRLSAVFGGIYCLNSKVDKIDNPMNESGGDGRCFQIDLGDNGFVSSDILISDYSYAIDLNLIDQPRIQDKLARAILITGESIKLPNDDKSTSFMRIQPSKFNENVVYLMEENASLSVCPPDINLVYLWTRVPHSSSEKGPQEILTPIIRKLFPRRNSSNTDTPKKSNDDADSAMYFENNILWEFYYEQTALSADAYKSVSLKKSDKFVGQLHITNPPCGDIDYEHIIKEADGLFKLLCPNEEFLPRAPDPDEIAF